MISAVNLLSSGVPSFLTFFSFCEYAYCYWWNRCLNQVNLYESDGFASSPVQPSDALGQGTFL